MAIKEFINFGDDGLQLGFNVSSTVGTGGRNHRGDVMLIQAIFNYLSSSPGVVSYQFKNTVMPEVNGKFSPATGELIQKYQTKWVHVVLRADGVIHPASYKNRVLADRRASRRLMTITLLHEHANQAAAEIGDSDYTEAILFMFPHLSVWVG